MWIGFVWRSLKIAAEKGHQFSTKGFGQNGLVEFRHEPRCIGMLGGDAVEPREGGFDTADDLVLFGQRGDLQYVGFKLGQ